MSVSRNLLTICSEVALRRFNSSSSTPAHVAVDHPQTGTKSGSHVTCPLTNSKALCLGGIS